MKISAILIASAALALPVCASAGNPKEAKPIPEGKDVVANPGQTAPEEKVICRRDKVIGSRLAAKSICKTQAEWDHEQREQRQTIERGQQQRTYSDGGG